MNSKHQVENLTIIGWLLCKHWSDETQTTELWHIINPTILPSVSRNEVYKKCEYLCYIAIDLNEKLVQAMPKSPEQASALKYHQRLRASKKGFLKKLAQMLPDEIAQESIGFLTQIFRSYDLRMAVAGDRPFNEATAAENE